MVKLVKKKFSRDYLFWRRGRVFRVVYPGGASLTCGELATPGFKYFELCRFECLMRPTAFSLAREKQLHNCPKFFWKISNFPFFIKAKFESLRGISTQRKKCIKCFPCSVAPASVCEGCIYFLFFSGCHEMRSSSPLKTNMTAFRIPYIRLFTWQYFLS